MTNIPLGFGLCLAQPKLQHKIPYMFTLPEVKYLNKKRWMDKRNGIYHVTSALTRSLAYSLVRSLVGYSVVVATSSHLIRTKSHKIFFLQQSPRIWISIASINYTMQMMALFTFDYEPSKNQPMFTGLNGFCQVFQRSGYIFESEILQTNVRFGYLSQISLQQDFNIMGSERK